MSAIRRGFTLIEVMAVIFLTAIVFGVALDFYIDLSNQSQRASDATRELRRATALLDRVARDFERVVLAQKPPEVDPLAHPWLFLGERRHAEQTGSDRLKFAIRRPSDARSVEAVGDVATVAYVLQPDDVNGDFRLMRWSQPHLPEDLDRDFPSEDDPASLMMADGVLDFSVRFLDEAGEWMEEWDSSQLLDSSELPTAVEIQVALAPLDPDALEDVRSYRRRVVLPVRPLDLVTLLDPVAYAKLGRRSAGGEDGECELRVSDCFDFSLIDGASGEDPGDLSALAQLTPEGREAVRNLDLNALANACWDDFRDTYGNHPAVRPQCR